MTPALPTSPRPAPRRSPMSTNLLQSPGNVSRRVGTGPATDVGDAVRPEVPDQPDPSPPAPPAADSAQQPRDLIPSRIRLGYVAMNLPNMSRRLRGSDGPPVGLRTKFIWVPRARRIAPVTVAPLCSQSSLPRIHINRISMDECVPKCRAATQRGTE